MKGRENGSKKGRENRRKTGRENGRKKGRKNGRRKGRKKETKKKKRRNGEKESTGIWEGVKTTPPGSKEPVKIFLKKQLDADSAALSRK